MIIDFSPMIFNCCKSI